MAAGWALWPVALCDLWETAMSNGKPCEAHNIPVDICARCRGALEERERILILVRESHPKGHNLERKPLCSSCVLIDRINGQA